MYSSTIVILNDLEEETGGYLQLSFDRVPKKNRNSLAQLGKQYTQWLNKHGVSSKIYYLNNNSSTTINGGVYESLGSIAKTLSMGNDGELWVVLQFYRDQAHADQVRSKMMQDEIIVALGKEFYSLVTPGKEYDHRMDSADSGHRRHKSQICCAIKPMEVDWELK